MYLTPPCVRHGIGKFTYITLLNCHNGSVSELLQREIKALSSIPCWSHTHKELGYFPTTLNEINLGDKMY